MTEGCDVSLTSKTSSSPSPSSSSSSVAAAAAAAAVVVAPMGAGAGVPELLPCGYLVGDVDHIDVFVKTPAKYALPACLSLDPLIPLPILNR